MTGHSRPPPTAARDGTGSGWGPVVPPCGLPSLALGVVTIDLGALARNWRSLAALVAPAECAAVVKADGYGLGAARIVPALEAAGCRTFFVATVDEAVACRRSAPGAMVLVLDGVAGADVLIAEDLVPVLATDADIRAWSGASAAAGRRLAAALHIDTGLNRLGLDVATPERRRDVAARLADIDVGLVMSHLACADEPGHAMNERQRAAFAERRDTAPGARASLAASDGLMLGRAYHFDLVRPGYALYGGQAFGGGRTPVEPVVAVAARILQVSEIEAGAAVGYGATWIAPSRRRIATLAAGYADGLARHLSAPAGHSGGEVAVRGARCPIVGRVSMDLTTVDVTDVAGPPVESGEWAEIVGPTLTIEEVGQRAGSIGYEVLTRLSRRFHRLYRGQD